MTHRSRFERIADIAGADDWDHDPWGTAMGLFFDVASVLDMSDVAGITTTVPFARWDYRPAPFATVSSIEDVSAGAEDFSEGEWADDYSFGEIMMASALESGQITQEDLVYAGDVLDRYTQLLRLAGKDF